MFDFENVISTAEADFDVGLLKRIDRCNDIYKLTNREVIDSSEIIINHKRNTPLNLKEDAETAVLLKNAGFSAWLIADSMPDDLIDDPQVELDRQEDEQSKMLGDVDQFVQEETTEPVIDEG
jgi:hypothetical protein